jgi:predicted MFS family arabinose efflux permease
MSSVVLVLFTLTYFRSPELAGAVTFFSVVPGLLIAPIAGALLDRHGRARLIVIDYLIAAGACVLIAILATTGRLTAPLLLLIAALNGLAWPLSTSGLRSLLPLMVPKPLWERANAMDSNGYVIATLLGPPAAGALVAIAGGPTAIALVGAVYALAAVVMVGIPDPRAPTESTGRLLVDAMDGLRYVIRNRTLRTLAVAVSLWNIGGGMLQILIPVLLIDRLGEGPAVVGLAWAASGLAGLVAALVVGRIDSRGREKRLMIWPLVATSVAILLLLVHVQLVTIVIALSFIGLFNGPVDVALFTIRQRRTDQAWMGRAFAVSMSLNFTGFPIGSALGGLLVTRSVELTVILAAATALLAAIAVWRLVPEHDERVGNEPPGEPGEPDESGASDAVSTEPS